MRIEFGDVRVGEVAKKHILEALATNRITSGPKVKLFEETWNNLFGYTVSRAVSSGTDACINGCLSLYDFGAKRGDEIIAPALSFIATSNAIRLAGFRPSFVDIEKETLNINPDLIYDKVTDRTVAIQVVHTMGRPCDMDKIKSIADEYNLLVLEDCCEAHGARYKGEFVGTFGHVAAFSFYVAHLICCSEGGMVSSMNPRVGDVVHSTRSHGRRNGALYFDHVRTGLNSKMTDLAASVGLEAIGVFWDTFNRRHDIMTKVMGAMDSIGAKEHAWFSEEDLGNVNCPHGLSITMKDPNRIVPLQKHLEGKSIHWKRNFGSIPTQHLAFADLGYELGDFPNAEYVGDNGLHIGTHQYLSDDDVDFIIESLTEFFR